MDKEILLPGGNIAPVVRVGDTVRRVVGPWSDAVHALLLHLEAKGFRGAPRFLGMDDKGREILTYIEGEVPNFDHETPDYVWRTANIETVAQLMRDFHDAAADFIRPPRSQWRLEMSARQRETVCHNDIAPYNVVYVDERPTAFIDWDFASDGTRAYDVAFALWRFVPMCAEERARQVGVPDIDERWERMRIFLDAYGMEERSDVMQNVLQRQRDSIEGIRRLADRGEPPFVAFREQGVDLAMERDFEYLLAHRHEIEEFLI